MHENPEDIIKKRIQKEGEKEGDEQAFDAIKKGREQLKGDPDWKKKVEEKKKKLYEMPEK